MKFPVPKTLHGAFSPTFLINWIFGIGVIEYPMGRRRPIISALSSIVNLLVYLGFRTMANLSEFVTFQESKLAANSYRINAFFRFAFVISSMCLARINAKVANGTVAKLTALNDKLIILGIPTEYQTHFKSQIIQLCIAFSLMFVLMGLDFKYIGFEFFSRTSHIGFLMASHYFMAFAFIVDYTSVVVIRYFGNRFQRLNQLLEESDALAKGEPSFVEEKKNQFPHYPSLINEIHQFDSIAIRAADRRWLLYVIRETRKVHRGLCSAAMESNRAYGMQMLFSMALSFGLIISLLYSSYTIAVGSSRHRKVHDKWIHVFNHLIWVTAYVTKVLLTVDACDTTSCEANRTGQLLSRLHGTTVSNEDIRDEINIFSLQLIKNPLSFTACGFFTLDHSLIRAMIGSVTTYLIIMIQMQSIYEPEKSNSMENSTMLVQTNGTN